MFVSRPPPGFLPGGLGPGRAGLKTRAMQTTLFEITTAEDAGKIVRLMSGEESKTRALGIQLARNKQVSFLALLKIAIRQKWNRDFVAAWDGFERTGRMQYCLFQFGHIGIDIHEDEAGQLCLNRHTVYVAGPDDEFSEKLTEKYISHCNAHIERNAVYFMNNITGTWKK